MTSSLSTVPYSQEQCEANLRLIRNIPESDRAEGYRNCVLARIWSEIDGSFFASLRGEETPRLSHTQRPLPEPNVRDTHLLNFLKGWLMLGSWETYKRTLNGLWEDMISYTNHWKKFMVGMMNKWKMHSIWVSWFLRFDLDMWSGFVLFACCRHSWFWCEYLPSDLSFPSDTLSWTRSSTWFKIPFLFPYILLNHRPLLVHHER